MKINNADLHKALKKLKAQKLITRDAQISEALGYSKGVLSEYINDKKQVSELFMRKLYDAFPQVKEAEKSSQKRTKSSQPNAVLLDENDYQVMMVPLVNKYAYAGYQSGFGDDEYIENLPRVPFMVDKQHKGNYRAFEVKGDSMDNGLSGSYKEGYIVLGREIAKTLWRDKLHLRKWKTFVVVTKTDGILIKEITRHDAAKGIIVLHSLNEEYKDVELHLDNVAQLFNVVQTNFRV